MPDLTITSLDGLVERINRPITENERYWIEVIRLASHDPDPAPTLARTQALRQVFRT
ncbi:hypothetical protein [Aquibium microcysteis]|uniref:hypothetical protein n=1 Tax=Aquibium microcysteis TaxID=675281 RepID=UPI00165D046D|nr:hypothetical protein [Aquibium microcysteis]